MERKQNRQSKSKKRPAPEGGIRRDDRRKRLRYGILAAVIAAALVFVGVRAHAISQLSGQIAADETRMKLTAMAEQDVSALWDEIALKREVADVQLPSLNSVPGSLSSAVSASDEGIRIYAAEVPSSDLTKKSPFLHRVLAVCRRIGGSSEQNGVLFGENRQLMADIYLPEEETLRLKANALNDFVSHHPEVDMYLLLVPDAAGVWSDRLPRSLDVEDQAAVFSDFADRLAARMVWIDGMAALGAHAEDPLYYRTDHHWTTLGAYDMFLEIADEMGISDAEGVVYDTYCASSDFNGTLAAASGFLRGEREEIEVFLPREYTSCLVTYPDTGETYPSLYSLDALDSDNPYAVFLDGAHPLVEIETGSDNMETLLVVKDSFANSFLPFLIPYYTRILVVDPASYTGSLDTLTEAYGVNDVLFLYGGNSFFSDTNLTRNLLAD